MDDTIISKVQCILFRYSSSFQELKTVVLSVPEITEVVGSSCVEQVLITSEEDGEKKLKEVLQSVFTLLMSASKAVITERISKLTSRLNTKRKVCENYISFVVFHFVFLCLKLPFLSTLLWFFPSFPIILN